MKGTAIDQSSLEPFYVGGFVDSKSWGKRFHELACTGAVDGHPTRWSPKDFQCIEKIGKGHFGTVFHATTTSHTEEAPCREVALKRISKRVVVDDAGRQRSRCLDLLRSEIFIHSS
jgi:serine/threonine protein kinase